MPAAQAINSGDQKVRIDRVLAILRRRAWLVTVLVAAAVTVTLSVVFFLPDIYRSSTTVLVERQRVPEEFVRSTINREADSRLQEISEEIMSRSRLVSLIDKHGLYPGLRKRRPIDEVVQRMRNDMWLEIKGAGDSNDGMVAFTITYRGADAKTVAMVANEFAATYIEEDLKVRNRQSGVAADFLRGELDDMKKQLENQERAVKDFKERYMGELPQQETANLSTLERLSAQLLLNSEKQALAHERQIIVDKQLGVSGNAVSASPVPSVTRLEEASRELAELRQRFTDKYPDVVRLRAEIAELERQLDAGNGDDPGRGTQGEIPHVAGRMDGVPGANAELRLLKAEEQRLRGLIGEYEERIENTPRREQEFRALQRDYETTQQVYQSLLKRYEEAKLAESLEHNQRGEQFRILDPALVSERPVAPNRLRSILLGLLLSVGLAAMAAAVAEALDSSFHSAEELRAVSTVPVLATIPRIVTETDRRGSARRLWLGATSTIVGLLLIVAFSYFIASQNTWLAARLA